MLSATKNKVESYILQEMIKSNNIETAISKVDYITARIESLNTEYHQKLIEHNHGIDRKSLKSKDMINLIPILEYDKNEGLKEYKNVKMPTITHTSINKEYYKKYNWLSCIPCFQEGVFRVNIGRYLYFKIKNIDVDTKSITLFLQDYTYNFGMWSVGPSGTVTYTCNPNATFDQHLDTNMTITVSDVLLYKDVCTQIPYSELNWSKNDIKLWQDIVIDNTKSVNAELKQQNTNNFLELTKYFQHFCILSNQLLYQHKPKAIRETKEQRETRKRTIVNAEATPRKITRIIGPIKMTSIKPPKYPTNETIIHYKTAVWKCRGGVRHMKSGKLIPFKSSIHHRKCLTTDTKTPQIEIKFTK